MRGGRQAKRVITWMLRAALAVAGLLAVAQGVSMARHNLGNVLLVRGSMQGDAVAAQQAREVLEGLLKSPTSALAHRSLARLALQEGRFQDARKHAVASIEMAPADWNWGAYDLAGQAYWALGQKVAARATWQKMDLVDPRVARSGQLGWQSFRQGDYETGLAHFRYGLGIDPDWVGGYDAISQHYWQQNQGDQARPYLEGAARLFAPGSADQLFVQARLSQLDGSYAVAADQYCQAWRLVAPERNSLSSSSLFGCLWALWHTDDLDGGEATIREAAIYDPQPAARYAASWADRLLAAGRYAQSVRFYRIACPDASAGSAVCAQRAEAERMDLLDPRVVRSGQLGWQSFRQGDYETGLAHFRYGLGIDPDWVGGYDAISQHYWQQNQGDQARPYLEGAARLFAPGSADQLFVQARLSQLDGSYAVAADQYCQAWRLVAPERNSLSSSSLFGCLWALWHTDDLDGGEATIREAAIYDPQPAARYAASWADRLFDAGSYAQSVRFYRLACPDASAGSAVCAQRAEAEGLADNVE